MIMKNKLHENHDIKKFEDMIKDYDISVLADKSITKKRLLADLEKYYPKEKQNECGVLCIEIELI